MLYMIIGRDVRNSLEDVRNSLERRLAVRPAHLERLQALQAQGRLVLAGPLPALDSPDPGPAGFLGSLIVAEFDSLSDARDWAEVDPYATHGVFTEVEVLPFKKVLPA